MSPTDKQLAAGQRRTLRAMSDRLMAMADAWDGRDQFNHTQLTELAEQAVKVAADMVADDTKD